MTLQRFFASLATVSAATGCFLALCHFLFEPMRQHAALSVSLVAIFSALCLVLYLAGRNAVRSKSNVAFTGLVSGSVFGKMLLSMAILFVYQQIYHPANQWFVGIFLLVYVVYTLFEVWFMSKIATGK